ncbi:MAG: site-specific DNA-methyltransferase [Succinivibrio sp.]|jgi:site-specific DNA-methyltransferase (adenine-specific)|nr:site-specific DNA-methyltransferase [Succinivibrio sp.]
MRPFYQDDLSALYLGDSLELLKEIKPGSVDMIFADPPYFLSNGGITCRSGTMASVNKGDWDKIKSSEDKHEFNRSWIRLCRQCLTQSGTIWISGTLHNIYSIGWALEQEGFKIINNITWQKTNPPPNLACRCFTHSTETIIWAQKNEAGAKHYFNYALMKEQNGGKQMKDVWTGTLTPPKEKSFGRHPTQKPLYLLTRIIEASTHEGDLVLDPFCGSSTTGVAAEQLNRRYIGIDNEKMFLEVSQNRLEEEYVSRRYS